MDDTPKPGETVAPKAPENNATPTAPVQGNAVEQELEKLRKEAEQARLRANQLENEKKARDEADAKKQAEQLVEKEEYKTLFEQEKAKREALEADKAADEKRTELTTKKTEVLKDYNDEVKALAQEAGMDLSDTDEATITTFKGKLDKIATMVSSNAKVTPNNPNRPSVQPNSVTNMSSDDLKLALKDPAKAAELLEQLPTVQMMTSSRPSV